MLRFIGVFRHFWWRLRRPLLLGVRVAVFDDRGHVLLVRHTYTPGWHLPGGGVDKGETAPEAGLREVREETGLTLTGPLRLHGLFVTFNHGASNHVALYVVTISHAPAADPAGTQAHRKRDRWEIAETGWFPADDLPRDATPATRRRLQEIRDGIDAPDLW
jgi:8-oxo-dGTP pyrophosphatase MutT (NUDIX family)